MKLISEYTGGKILFNQPSVLKRIHELRANDELIGTLQQKGFFGITWEVSLLNKKLEIYKPSFWRTALEVREAGYEMPFASFLRKGFKSAGTVLLPKGERVEIVPHLFKGFTDIKNEQDESIVHIIPKISMHDKAEVIIQRRTELIDKYPWIIILAYIITIEQRHQAARAAH